MKTLSAILLAAICCGCHKESAQFTNDYSAELQERMALAEWGYRYAQTEKLMDTNLGGHGHSGLQDLTNSVAIGFKTRWHKPAAQ